MTLWWQSGSKNDFLFFIRGEFVEAVLAQVGPVVVGGAVGGDGEGGLLFVEQYLDEYVFVFWITAVEDELQVIPSSL